MKKTITTFAILLAKIIIKLVTIFRLGQGGTVAGRIALSIDKSLLANFKFGDNTKVIFITGTNGKSTTCGLVAAILETAGHVVAYNKSGANLKSGIANTLCFFSNLSGEIDYDYVILEVDEATLPHITKDIKADLIAVTNLFRDQLDRFGELDTTLNLIEKGINNNREALVVLNADDEKLSTIKLDNKKIYYEFNSIREKQSSGESWLSDPIEYTTTANKNKPECEFQGSNLKTDDRSSNFDVKSSTFKINKQNFFLPFIGKFNVCNALAAIAITKSISNATANHIQKAFSSYSTIFGRAEKVNINNKSHWVYLIKNPAGTTEVLKTLSDLPNARFLIALNDNYADGRDVSWIWDARFDLLEKHNKEIFTSGNRCYDIALRLKYAKIDSIHVEEDIESAINFASASLEEEETLYILPTYTILLEMQKKKLCKQQPL